MSKVLSVVDYRPNAKHPTISVERAKRGEIPSFPIEAGGSVGRADGRSDLGDPRRAAIAHVFSLDKRAGSIPVTNMSF